MNWMHFYWMYFYWMHRWNAAAFPNPKQMVITSVAPGVVYVIEKSTVCSHVWSHVIANIKVQQLAFYTSEVSHGVPIRLGMKIHHIMELSCLRSTTSRPSAGNLSMSSTLTLRRRGLMSFDPEEGEFGDQRRRHKGSVRVYGSFVMDGCGVFKQVVASRSFH